MNFINNTIREAMKFENEMVGVEKAIKALNIISDKRAKRIRKLALEYSKIMPLSQIDIMNELYNYLIYPEGLDLFNVKIAEIEIAVEEVKKIW